MSDELVRTISNLCVLANKARKRDPDRPHHMMVVVSADH
jgi:hypothetical protein